MELEVVLGMIRVALFLLLNCWVVSAWADPSDVLLDDFGEPIGREDQVILPPGSRPKSVTVKKPLAPNAGVSEAAKPVVKKQDPSPLPAPVKPVAKPAVKPAAPAVAKNKVIPPAPKQAEPAEEDVEIFGGSDVNLTVQPGMPLPKPRPEEAKQPATEPKVATKDQAATILPPAVIKIVPPLPGMISPPASEEEKSKVAKVPDAPVVVAPTSPAVDQPKEEKIPDAAPAPIVAAPKAEKIPLPEPRPDAAKVAKAPQAAPAEPKPNETWIAKKPQVNIFVEPDTGVNRAKKGDPILPPKAAVQPHPAEEEEITITRADEGEEEAGKKDGLPVAKLPPAPKSDVEIFGDGLNAASGGESSAGTGAPNEGEEVDKAASEFENDDSYKGDKGRKPVARIVPPPPGVILPPSGEREQISKLPPPRTARDREPVVEHLPIDINAYIDMQRVPNFIRINAHGYNIRNTPDFQSATKDNIYGQNVAGSFYAVTRIKESAEGVATGIFVDGEERWIFMPWERRNDFQYCESEACFADIKQGLDALTKPGSIDTTSLLACGITGVDYDGRPVIEHLPRKLDTVDLPPQRRTKSELEELDARVDHAPKVKVEYGEAGCVVDSRDRPKPNFRGARTTRELKRAFIDYMIPYALEVQEATGLPASVIIGQAALESRWGQSGLFTNTKNIFGHSCWREGRIQTIELKMGRERKRISGSCDTPRPTGGYYLNFRNAQDSIYAYAANLLTTDHNYYPGVRAAVNRAKPNPADWREVVSGLREYDSPNPEYRNLVRSIINANDLGKLENKKLCR